MRTRAWQLVLVGGGASIALYFLLGSPVRDFLYTGIGLFSTAAILLGVALNRPRHRAPWYLFALGQLSLVVGDLLFTLYDLYWEGAPFPSPADGFYLAGYPLLAAGLWQLIRRRSPGRDLPSLIDGAIIATGFGMLVWAFYVIPYGTDPSLTLTEKLFSAAYPVASILLLAFVARLLVGPGTKNPAFVLIGASVVVTLAADVWYADAILNASYYSGHPMDAGWLAAYVTWGAAALHPSMVEVSTPIPQKRVTLTRPRLALLTGVALLAPALLVFQAATDQDVQVPVVATGSSALFLLVVFRIAGLTQDIENKVRELDAKSEDLHRALEIREVLEQQLRRQAFQDPLTGLANRWLFMDRLEQAVAQRDRRPLAVMFIDLDDFKTVNDMLGHAGGDDLLKAVGERLAEAVREGDTAARFGGDEFAVLVNGVQEPGDTELVAQRIAHLFTRQFRIQDHEISVGSSIGGASSHGDIDAQELIRRADVAMYVAKRQPATPYIMFDADAHSTVVDRKELKGDLTQGLARDEFVPHLQPVVDLTSGRVVGVEALVRWNHPTRGLIAPIEFILLAEETGAIVELDRTVLREAAEVVSRWRSQFAQLENVWLSVNVSATGILQDRWALEVKEILGVAGLEPEHLQIEITERTLLLDMEATSEKLEQLRGMGARIAIDDFGIGYSSLSYLQRLPVDTLKIDHSFIDKINGNAEESALGRAVIKLGDSMKLTTIAEGVETQEQLAVLRSLGCRLGQGYLFARPLPADELSDLLRARGGVLI